MSERGIVSEKLQPPRRRLPSSLLFPSLGSLVLPHYSMGWLFPNHEAVAKLPYTACSEAFGHIHLIID